MHREKKTLLTTHFPAFTYTQTDMYLHVWAGPTKPLPERWIGRAPLNFTYSGVIFRRDVDDAQTNKLKAGLFFFFVREV